MPPHQCTPVVGAVSSAQMPLRSAMRDYIQDEGVRAAFDLLLTVENFNLVPRCAAWDGTGYGQKKSVGFYSPTSSRKIYSFTVNQHWLLFYIRNPGWCDEWDEQLTALKERFKRGDVGQNPRGEWRARVRTEDEARFIVELSTRTRHRLRLAANGAK